MLISNRLEVGSHQDWRRRPPLEGAKDAPKFKGRVD
jgi:hypothetical protein